MAGVSAILTIQGVEKLFVLAPYIESAYYSMQGEPMRKLVLILVIVSFLFSGCVSATNVTFYTDPEGADVYVDGKLVGESPTRKRMSNAVWANPRVRVEAEGYKPRSTRVDKEVKAANLALGLLLWWPALLWVQGP